jgi:hypothetical protein
MLSRSADIDLKASLYCWIVVAWIPKPVLLGILSGPIMNVT